MLCVSPQMVSQNTAAEGRKLSEFIGGSFADGAVTVGAMTYDGKPSDIVKLVKGLNLGGGGDAEGGGGDGDGGGGGRPGGGMEGGLAGAGGMPGGNGIGGGGEGRGGPGGLGGGGEAHQ